MSTDDASVRRICRRDWLSLLQGLASCGPVQTFTRSGHATLAAVAIANCVSDTGTDMARGADACVPHCFAQWQSVFTVRAAARSLTGVCLQMVDNRGQLVHSIAARKDRANWKTLMRRLSGMAASGSGLQRPASAAPPRIGESIRAMRWWCGAAPDAGCVLRELTAEAVTVALFAAAEDKMILRPGIAGSDWLRSCSGPVCRIRAAPHGAGRWLEVGGPQFDLRWRQDAVARVWAIRRPTARGLVSCVVALDAAGDLILVLEGIGSNEGGRQPSWPALVWSLPRRRPARRRRKVSPGLSLVASEHG